jgi:glycosyltransferase involved in cell wall biosynthesis
MVPSTEPILHTTPGDAGRTRVMFVLGSLAGGGAERIVAHLVNHINRDEFDVRVGLLWRDGPYLNEFADRDLVVPRLAQGWISYRDRPPWWRLLPAVVLVPLQQREVFLRFRPEIVVTVTKSMNIAASASLAGLGRRAAWVVREGNNTGAMIDSESRTGWGRRLQDLAVRTCYRRADRVVAISEGVGAGLARRFGIDAGRLRTVFNAVDLSQVDAGARQALALAIDRPFIVSAGRLVEQKGFDVLIRAYAAHVAGRGVDLVLLGEGPERASLERLARASGVQDRVHMPGFVSNPWAYFARASAFVCPSRWEGFGNVIVEAMAAGAPCVVTDCDFGPREIVQHGQTGLVVRVDDVDALGAAVGSLLDDRLLAARLAAAARRRSADFAVSRMAQAYEAIFRELRPRGVARDFTRAGGGSRLSAGSV